MSRPPERSLSEFRGSKAAGFGRREIASQAPSHVHQWPGRGNSGKERHRRNNKDYPKRLPTVHRCWSPVCQLGCRGGQTVTRVGAAHRRGADSVHNGFGGGGAREALAGAYLPLNSPLYVSTLILRPSVRMVIMPSTSVRRMAA